MQHTPFAEANLFLYHSIRSAVFDAIIWCLGPIVDEARVYGPMRRWLAAATVVVCRPIFAPTEKS